MKRLHWFGYRLLCWLYRYTPDAKAHINNAATWCWDRSTAPARWCRCDLDYRHGYDDRCPVHGYAARQEHPS